VVDDLGTATATDEHYETDDFLTSANLTFALNKSATSIIISVDALRVNSTESEWTLLTQGTDYNVSTGYHGSGIVTLGGDYRKNWTKVNYTYAVKDALLNATVDSLKGTAEISNQFGTIGIIAAMVIILMMIGGLTAYFGLR